MAYVMIDLETLGTTAPSIILSIGAVRFDDNQVLGNLYTEVNIDDQVKLGRTVSGRTLSWWNDQSPQARKVFDNNEKAPRLASALAKLGGLVEEDDTIWGNSAAFDISIVENAYDMLDVLPPWKFWNVRCYRTLKEMHPHVEMLSPPTVAHHAHDDALAQAIHMQAILKHMRTHTDHKVAA